ncbi:cell division suppressor protein YneA [Bacillus massiliglaciei]|uniref:cell division suppressor protein YneA n=1 Tax=Bacillus massiliglaciei TaxID=1816693 RepID=UPI000DA60FBF|nr:LysM peptidoglycan-binding domain-containing protein [Bacillus massiliglaciei]
MSNLMNKYMYTCLLAAMVFILSVFFSFSLQEDKREDYVSIEVKDGDTLWEIADRHEVPQLTKAEFIDWIEKHNGIQGDTLTAGKEITIPVSRGDFTHNLASQE